MVQQVRDPDIMIDLCHEQHDHARTTNQTYSSGKDRSHPIYHRSNAMKTRTSSTGASGFHSDGNKTVYSRSPRKHYGRDSRHPPDRATSSITLRSRSRSRRTHRTHQSFMDRRQGIHLYPRSYREPTSTTTLPTDGEPSHSEAESTRVPIPTPAAVDLPDWNRSSQERERNDDTEEGEIN